VLSVIVCACLGGWGEGGKEEDKTQGKKIMSSLAAACADGYYQPELKAERNRKSKRPRQADGGVVVRFAMPRNGKCLTCNSLVPGGVRFNAIKRSRPGDAYSFEFTCKNCKNKLFVSTDPARAAFVFESPLAEMHSFIAAQREAEAAKKEVIQPALAALERKREEARFFEDHLGSRDEDENRARKLRDAMRSRRRLLKAQMEDGARLGLGIPLLSRGEEKFDLLRTKSQKQPRLMMLADGAKEEREANVSIVKVVRRRKRE
jgi:hypothetical protein